jgi:hypothetical protein
LSPDRVAYRHDSVVWVYATGGEITRWAIFLVPVDNRLLALEPGDGCVFVTEGYLGGCSITPESGPVFTHALDARTGRAILALGPAKRMNRQVPIWHEDKHCSETVVEVGLSVYSDSDTLRLSPDVMILRVKDADPEVLYPLPLGEPIAAFRMPDDLLVVGLSYGYVVCIDLKKIHGRSSTQATQSSTCPARR